MSPDIAPMAILRTSTLPAHDGWRDEHWASPGPDASVARTVVALGSSAGAAQPTARVPRRSTRSPVGALVGRVIGRHLA